MYLRMSNWKWISMTEKEVMGAVAEKKIFSAKSAGSGGTSSVKVKYTLQGFWQLDSVMKKQKVITFDLPEGGHITQVGAPMLISEGMFVEIPSNARFTGIKILECGETELDGDFDIIPVPEPTLETEEPKYIQDKSIYGSADIYPKIAVEYVDTLNISGTRCVHVMVCPMKYRPKSKKLILIHSLTFEIQYSADTKAEINLKTKSVVSENEFFSLSQILKNVSGLKKAAKPSKPRMLIVSVSKFKSALDLYLRFRKDELKMDIVMCDKIYTKYPKLSKADAIKKYIWEEHAKSSLKYVLLAGDIANIPSCVIDTSGGSFISDIYYGIKAKEVVPQFGVSRFPAASNSELKGMFQQAAKYTTLSKRKNKNSILTTYEKDTYEICSNEIYNDANKKFKMVKCYDGKCTKTTLINKINEGNVFINYRGHGAHNGWASSIGLSTSDVNTKLKDTDCYPHIFSICCSNNDMGQKDCFGVAWMKKHRAITFLGASTPTNTSLNNLLDKYLWEALNRQNLTNIMEVFAWAVTALYKNDPRSEATKFHIQQYLLLGDPIADYTEEKNFIPDVYYRVKTGGKWGSVVKNFEGCAGIKGKPITDVAIKFGSGTCKYRVRVKANKKWLPWVTGYDIKGYNNGYAGNGKEIDAIQVYYYTPTELVELLGYYLKAQYRVSPVNGNYYSYQYDTEQTNGQDGYAGCFGKSIDRLQIKLTK